MKKNRENIATDGEEIVRKIKKVIRIKFKKKVQKIKESKWWRKIKE